MCFHILTRNVAIGHVLETKFVSNKALFTIVPFFMFMDEDCVKQFYTMLDECSFLFLFEIVMLLK